MSTRSASQKGDRLLKLVLTQRALFRPRALRPVLPLIMAALVALMFTWGSGLDKTQAGPNATAKVITASQDLIDGPLSRGRVGDFLLANSEIQVVIQDVQRNLFTVGTYGGHILDADLVRATGDPERDSFEEWAFGINAENTAHYTSVSIINDGSNGQPAVIRAIGVDDLSAERANGHEVPLDVLDHHLDLAVREQEVTQPPAA